MGTLLPPEQAILRIRQVTPVVLEEHKDDKKQVVFGENSLPVKRCHLLTDLLP